jgi:hypothetical protein
MAAVANKIRFFFIWEQDSTYQDYIRPHWGKYNILTIISDQFLAIAYYWDQNLPPHQRQFFHCGLDEAAHHPESRSADCALQGQTRTELSARRGFARISAQHRDRTAEHGVTRMGRLGRPVRPGARKHVARSCPRTRIPVSGGEMVYASAWGRTEMKKKNPNRTLLTSISVQCGSGLRLCRTTSQRGRTGPSSRMQKRTIRRQLRWPTGRSDRKAGATVPLSAAGSKDPDGDELTYRWWQYREAGTYGGHRNSECQPSGRLVQSALPSARTGDTIHIICEVTDPELRRSLATSASW